MYQHSTFLLILFSFIAYGRIQEKKEQESSGCSIEWGFVVCEIYINFFHLHKPVKAALISALWIIRGHNSLNGMKKLKAQVFFPSVRCLNGLLFFPLSYHNQQR